RLEDALTAGRQTLALLAEVEHVVLVSAAHHRLAQALAACGHWQEAFAEYRAALAAASATGNPYDEALAQFGLADVDDALRRVGPAEQARARGRQLFADLGVPPPADPRES